MLTFQITNHNNEVVSDVAVVVELFLYLSMSLFFQIVFTRSSRVDISLFLEDSKTLGSSELRDLLLFWWRERKLDDGFNDAVFTTRMLADLEERGTDTFLLPSIRACTHCT